MRMDRREFLQLSAGAVLFGRDLLHVPGPQARPKAVLFDAFPILNPKPVFDLAETVFPGRGAELSALWRTRVFEYTWLRSLTDRYADFHQVIQDSLNFAAKSLKLELSPDKSRELVQAFYELKAYPDVEPALTAMRSAGVKVAFLSNMTSKMLLAGLKNSGLESQFDHVISTDRAKIYKPHPRAYQLGIDTFKLRKEEFVFAAFAGWDAAGAKSFGYRTYWVNRQNAPAEELGVSVDSQGSGMVDLAKFVLA